MSMIIKFKQRTNAGVEAVQWTGDNGEEIVEWAPGAMLLGSELTIPGQAGQMIPVRIGNWVIKRPSGEVRTMTGPQLRWAYEEA